MEEPETGWHSYPLIICILLCVYHNYTITVESLSNKALICPKLPHHTKLSKALLIIHHLQLFEAIIYLMVKMMYSSSPLHKV